MCIAIPTAARAAVVLTLAAGLMATSPVLATDTSTLGMQTVPEWKAVYGRVEARDLVPARARIGGTIVELVVSEGDTVAAGQRIATVRDDKLAFQIAAIDAQLGVLDAQLSRAEAELSRGRSLVQRGVSTAQRLEQLQTDWAVTVPSFVTPGGIPTAVVAIGTCAHPSVVCANERGANAPVTEQGLR